MRLDWDQRLFDKLCDFSGYMLDKGYTKAWFTWLGWVTIVAGLVALGIKGNSWMVICLGIMSGIMLFFTALAGVERFAADLAGTLHIKRLYVRIVLLILLLGITPAVVFEILKVAVGIVLKTSV